ncbi:hypothetical protein RUM44_006274 [Polyplax serrata]|uniref:Putative ionotropic receptor ligand binding domain-containing protein n=1 Tax=Polyplax serrata TaxID=468196 RepID=A0ABR1AHM6_POLSC
MAVTQIVRVIFYSIVLFCRAIATAKITPTEKDLTEECLRRILNRYFQNESLLVVIDEMIPESKQEVKLLVDAKERFSEKILRGLMSSQSWPFHVSYNDKYLNFPAEMRLKRLNQCILFLPVGKLKPEDILKEGMTKLKRNPLWKPSGRNLIVVLLENSNLGKEDIVRRVIRALWEMSRASDNLIMIVEKGEKIFFYTWFPYRKSNCLNVTDIVHLDTYSDFQFRLNTDLFPKKMDVNLNGCEVIAATDQCIPYVFYHDESGYLRKGIEISLVNQLAELMNFRLKLVKIDNIGMTSINGTAVGVFDLLIQQKIDFAFACLMLNQERYLLAQAVHPYLYDSLVWFVPSPTLETHAGDLFLSFDRLAWFAMLLVLIVSTLVVALMRADVRAGENPSWFASFFDLVGMSVSVPIQFSVKRSIFRIFVFLFYIYAFHVTVSFQSSLFGLFKQPHFSRVYGSVDEAIDDELYVYLYRFTKGFYNQTNHPLWNRILRPERFTYADNFTQAFREIADKKNTMALYIKFPGMYMVSVNFRNSKNLPMISWLDEEFSRYPVTLYLSPGNPLFPLFQTHLQRIREFGFFHHWGRQIVDLRNPVTIRCIRLFTNYGEGPLNWKQLNGSFFLLFTLLSVALIVFICELVLYNREIRVNPRKLNNKLKLWIDESKEMRKF